MQEVLCPSADMIVFPRTKLTFPLISSPRNIGGATAARGILGLRVCSRASQSGDACPQQHGSCTLIGAEDVSLHKTNAHNETER